MPDNPSRIVISNTSPLLYLSRIGHLDLLREIYGRVIVPRQVIVELNADRGPAVNLTELDWVVVRTPAVPEPLRFIADLGSGEAAVLALALENPADSVAILDDKLARRIALYNKLKVTGTAGLLIKAKQMGLIPAVRPLFEALCAEGFYLREDHIKMLARMAGEN